jgi:hypothetical protein
LWLGLQAFGRFPQGSRTEEQLNRLKLAIMAAALVVAVQARASFFDITFSDGGANEGHGVLTATEISPGNWNVTDATFDVTAGVMSGSYSLVPNPYAPNPAIGPVANNVHFTYDNQATYPATPYLDVYGLFFGSGSKLLNIWGNSSTDYEFLGQVPPYDFDFPAVDAHGMVTLTPVPEPTTMVAGAMLLLPFGFSTLRMFRRRTA